MDKNIINIASAKAAEAMDFYGIKHNDTEEANFNKVLEAMMAAKIGDRHLHSTTGYGYDDTGRDALEEIYAKVLGTEAALMRQQIVSGTHAISLALMGNLLPGDELLYVGSPYDTLHKVIGHTQKVPGSMTEMGIEYREVDFDYNAPNPQTVVDAIKANTKIVALQRSKGYNWRASLSIAVLADLISAVKKAYPSVIVFVDNCYGEFVETKEPPKVGADLIAGSLIKNPGGGLAPCGGYVAGKADLVERAAARLTSPGIGKEIGPSLMDQRLYYQGLFMAPSVVGEALRGAVFAACLWHELGFKVLPHYEENRTDIIQAIELKEKERLLAFCRGIQKYAPIDSYVTPMPWDMPGYTSQVIMAAGTFVQGSSIELSADAPVKEPYIVYFQGGLNRYHAKTAVSRTAKDMLEAGLI